MDEQGWTVRSVWPTDADFLLDMTMEAANWTPRRRVTRRQVADDPALSHYSTGWPRAGDLGVLAVDAGGQPIGAAWLRRFGPEDPGYGYVGPDVPELTVAVVPMRRGRGIGRALLEELFHRAAGEGVEQVSLSVERGNRAASLYTSMGFRPAAAGAGEGPVTMVLDLSPYRPAG